VNKEEGKNSLLDLEMKSFILISFLVFVSWPIFLIVSYTVCKYQNLDMPSPLYFFIPIIYLAISHFALKKKIKIPFIKGVESNTNFIFYTLLLINFLWSVHVSMLHDKEINGYFLIFSLGLIQVFQSTTGLFNAKITLISGIIKTIFFMFSYLFLYKSELSTDDLFATHFLWVSILFFSFLNETITRQIKRIKEIQFDLEVNNMELDDYSEHIHRLLKEVENHNKFLKVTVEEKTKEIRNLLDHMKLAIFAVNEDFKILNPISKHSEEIFEQAIIGKSIFDVLYPDIKDDSKEYEDINCSFPLFFGEDEFQFSAFKENLPEIVKVPIETEDGESEKLLKLSYAPIFDDSQLVERVLFLVEDITQSEEFFFEANDDFIDFRYVKEVIARENKEKIALILEIAIKEGLILFNKLYYNKEEQKDPLYFKGVLTEWFDKVRKNVNDLVLLDRALNREFWYVDKLDPESDEFIDLKSESPQLISLSILGSGLNLVFKYSSNAELFFPVFYELDYPFIYDISLKFDNLQESLMSLRQVNNENLNASVLKVINQLILLFSLSKIIQHDQLAMEIDDLRYHLKKHIEKNDKSISLFGKTYNKVTTNILKLTKSLKEDIDEKIEKKKEEKAA
tara:strand:+ start:722 stop:2590 length:1869 start_codon:yes stop_codon:yes gene_type:complete